MKPDFFRIEPAGWEPPLIAVIGMGTCPGDLGPFVREWIGKAQTLVGGARHLDLFPDHTGEKIALGPPLSELIELIGRISITRRTAVLASGDPLFFGIGKRLGERLGWERLIIVPNVTSVQVLCARVRQPWGDVETVSLHGREGSASAAMARIIEKLSHGVTVAVFTDPTHTPRWIAKNLCESGNHDCVITVGEDLGSPAERIREFTPLEASNETFSDLNLVLLRPPATHSKTIEEVSETIDRSGPKPDPLPSREGLGEGERGGESNQVFGFSETCFEREAGLITKMEIRAVALALLRLMPGQVLWDVGAGTGSISIEAARLAPLKCVYAIEKNEARYEKMLENIKTFGASTVAAVPGGAPEALLGLPDPDRVFIGGSGIALPEILDAVSKRLLPGGGVVQTVVLLETLERVKNFWIGHDFEVSLTQLQVSRSVPLGKDLRLEALNPVFIVSARRRCSDGRK